MSRIISLIGFCIFLIKPLCVSAHNEDFPEVVKALTPSVVAIGLYSPLKHTGNQIRGTGFVVGDGRWVVTNYHVVDQVLDPSVVEHFVVVHGEGKRPDAYKASIEHIDTKHDLALLRIEKALTPVNLKSSELVAVGTQVALTGYPIGAVLGLYAATHRGYVAAITPDVLPNHNARQLTVDMLSRLENTDLIYQLDATAYPGNSGSPLYLADTGEVVGVINKVFISAGKESAISTPTGISYAIPVKHVHALLLRAKQD
ncbi:S1 family peptidase [Alteromonas sp. D210916BOD_24]|uniref:S1 family peptidase n=1 Tax=Alteromonas sp. D210916BOD_24 TaxID=3157618 RepID=UPI00399D2CD4